MVGVLAFHCAFVNRAVADEQIGSSMWGFALPTVSIAGTNVNPFSLLGGGSNDRKYTWEGQLGRINGELKELKRFRYEPGITGWIRGTDHNRMLRNRAVLQKADEGDRLNIMDKRLDIKDLDMKITSWKNRKYGEQDGARFAYDPRNKRDTTVKEKLEEQKNQILNSIDDIKFNEWYRTSTDNNDALKLPRMLTFEEKRIRDDWEPKIVESTQLWSDQEPTRRKEYLDKSKKEQRYIEAVNYANYWDRERDDHFLKPIEQDKRSIAHNRVKHIKTLHNENYKRKHFPDTATEDIRSKMEETVKKMKGSSQTYNDFVTNNADGFSLYTPNRNHFKRDLYKHMFEPLFLAPDTASLQKVWPKR